MFAVETRREKTCPSLVFSRVSLPEEPPTAPPQNVIASGRTNQSIMIQWQPPPENHQNGILKGYVIRWVSTPGTAGKRRGQRWGGAGVGWGIEQIPGRSFSI